MDVFALRNRLVGDYAGYVQSFIHIREARIREHVQQSLAAGVLCPEPLIQLNPPEGPARATSTARLSAC
jgi:hypothetical protein